jgi:hypothetical protein
VIGTLVNDDDDDKNEANMASAGSFVREDRSNYKGQREQFRGGFGLQGAVKEIQKIVETFQHRIC